MHRLVGERGAVHLALARFSLRASSLIGSSVLTARFTASA